ncbi:hypothetical protein ACOZ0W_001992 [Cronobacter dublinensis]
MKKLMLLSLICLFSTVCSAGEWPIITSIKTVPQGGTVYYYYITQTLLDIGPSVDVYMPNQTVILTHRHNPKSTNQIGISVVGERTSSTETISQTAKHLYSTQGSSIKFVMHSGGDAPTNSECVAYAVSSYTGEPVSSAHGSWSQVTVPGGCLMVPPADEWCKITTPELLLDHGTITLKEMEGNTATAQMGLQCTTATAVTFNMISNDKYVYLDEGKSEITVNDLPLKTKINLPQGDSTLPVKDLLTGVTSEGFHTGSSVLVMMPY